MKKGKWFYDAQRLFKQYKIDNNLLGECSKQTITAYTLEEEHLLWVERQNPAAYTLYAFKGTGEVYLLPKVGEPVRIYLRHRTNS